MDLKTLSICKYYLKRLERIAKESMPTESCALLLGENKSLNEYIVRKIIKMYNNIKSSDYFEIDPSDLLKVYLKSKSMNLDIIAIFHSHPSIAYPSKIDVIYMEINPVIWVIYSTSDFSFKAFFLNENKEIVEVFIKDFKD